MGAGTWEAPGFWGLGRRDAVSGADLLAELCILGGFRFLALVRFGCNDRGARRMDNLCKVNPQND